MLSLEMQRSYAGWYGKSYVDEVTYFRVGVVENK